MFEKYYQDLTQHLEARGYRIMD